MAISEGEKKLLKELDLRYEEGSAARSIAGKNWNHAIEVVRGETWPARMARYKVRASMNFLEGIVEKKAAILTDSRPAISVLSRNTATDPLCELLEKVIEGILDEKNFEQRLTELVMLEEHFGFGGFNTCFDSALDYGRGDIDLVVIDPRLFIFDPFVTRSYNLNYGEYCCLESIRPTEYLKEKYHDRRDEIKSDLFPSDQGSDSVVGKMRKLLSDIMGMSKNKEVRSSSVVPRSIVKDWYIRDRETKKDGELMFKNWRHIITAGGPVVEDGTNIYFDAGLPYDMMEWGFSVDSPYGRNEIDSLESVQQMLNKAIAVVIENATLMGNGQWVGEENALSKEDWQRLNNEPGSIVKKRAGKELNRVAPPSLPAYIMQTIQLLKGGMQELSTLEDVTQGRRPGQVTSGVAIESLAIQAQTGLRLKARQIEGLIGRVGQKLIPRIFQYYSEDRVFAMLGNHKGFKDYMERRDELRKLWLAKKSTDTAFLDYNFKVLPASSLAMTKWQKGLIATQLFTMQAIDRKALLDAMEFPDREEILARMEQAEAQAAEAMAQEGTPVSKPSGGGKVGQRLPATLLRGGHKEVGLQYPQVQKG